MARADRLERLDEHRLELETEYRALLLEALRQTAAGRRGLFGHHQDKTSLAKIAPILGPIIALGEQIDAMREQLGLEPFELHSAFLASRGPVKAHAVGEPKQAQAWLARLDAE
jgi:hypothetical protein